MNARRALLVLLLLAAGSVGAGVFVLHSLSPVASSERISQFRVEPGTPLGAVARDLEREQRKELQRLVLRHHLPDSGLLLG